MIQGLLLVADAIDRTGPVVGHQDRTILGEDDVVRTAEITGVALEPAGGKDFRLGVLAVGIDDHAFDAGALVLGAVPRAMLGDQDVVLVFGWELIAGIELYFYKNNASTE